MLEATCDFDSRERTEVTIAGATHHNEMCTLYMMMWSELPVFLTCGGGGTLGDAANIDPKGPGGSPGGFWTTSCAGSWESVLGGHLVHGPPVLSL